MSILTEIFKRSISMVSLLTRKPKFTDVLMSMVGWIPTLINQISSVKEMDSRQKLDEALETFDAFTGSEETAVDIIHDLPAEREEELFDHVKQIIRILAYNRLEVDGYVTNKSDDGAGQENSGS